MTYCYIANNTLLLAIYGITFVFYSNNPIKHKSNTPSVP